MFRSTTAFVSLLVLCVGLAVASAATQEKVNINQASVKELMTLEGVGKKLAEKIVEYRGAHGPFRRAEDLRKVDGVGAALWEKNRARIVVK
jgi:competence protein ComEA